MLKKSGGNDNGGGTEELKAFLGEGTDFKGTLSFTGTVRIDGKLEGQIISDDTLIVGEAADIKADISVGNLIARGLIRGNISAKKKVELRADSKIMGNIKSPVLVIEEGALFEGQCEMMKNTGEKKEMVSNEQVTE